MAPLLKGLFSGLIHFFGNGRGHTAGAVVAQTTAWGVLLAPLGLFLLNHRDEPAFTLTYGEVAIVGGILFLLVQVAYLTRAGRPQDRRDDFS